MQDVYSWRQQQGHVLGLQCTDEEETDALWEAGIAFYAAVLERGTTEGGTSIQPTKRQQRSRQTIIQSPEQVQCAQDQPSVCINKHHPATTASVRVCRRSPPGPCYPSLPIPANRHWNHCRGVEGGAGRTFECNFLKNNLFTYESRGVQPGFDVEQWGGDGREAASITYNQVSKNSLVIVGTTGERERAATASHHVGRRAHTCTKPRVRK